MAYGLKACSCHPLKQVHILPQIAHVGDILKNWSLLVFLYIRQKKKKKDTIIAVKEVINNAHFTNEGYISGPPAI